MIILSPYARALRSGDKNHPKNFPNWKPLINILKGLYPTETIVQVGSGDEEALPGITDFRKNLSLNELAKLVNECTTWISVDSFFQHFCWDLGKRGIVLWGQSDPNIFGHPENINLLKSRSYLREKQFWMWEQASYIPEAFPDIETIVMALKTLMSQEALIKQAEVLLDQAQ